MFGRSRLYVAGAIVGAAGLAALIPISSVISQESPPSPVINIEVGDTATIEARGAVAIVNVFYTCTPGGQFAFINVQLTQRSGSGIAGGGAGQEVTCNGGDQSVTLAVSASGRPFKKGVAFAQASGTVCGPGPVECGRDTDLEEIQLQKA